MMSTEPIIEDISELVGEVRIACDWADTDLHDGDDPARWQVTLVRCVCGRQGVRLVCGPCKNRAISTEHAAKCGGCGEVFQPWRKVIKSIVWLR